MTWLSNTSSPTPANNDSPSEQHIERVYRDIIRLGANAYDRLLPETRALPGIIHPDEALRGIVYGRYTWQTEHSVVGHGALVATDRRVLLVNNKPLFAESDEIGYRAISAVSYSRVWPLCVVVLHTRVGDIHIRTFNDVCARTFVGCIESFLVKLAQNGVANGNNAPLET